MNWKFVSVLNFLQHEYKLKITIKSFTVISSPNNNKRVNPQANLQLTKKLQFLFARVKMIKTFSCLETIKNLNLNLFQAHNSIQCDCRYYIALQWHFSDWIVVLYFPYWFTDFFAAQKSDRKEENNVEHDHWDTMCFQFLKCISLPFSADKQKFAPR